MTGEWPTCEVEDLIASGKLFVGDGYRAKNVELSDTGIPFARVANVNEGFRFEGADRFPEADLWRVGNKISEEGDVAFTAKGTVGRFAFVGPSAPRFVYSPQLAFWRSLDHDLLFPRFLYYWMWGREFHTQFRSVAGQTDMADYVNLADQRRMRITLPPIAHQRAIAHILGTLDDKIELNRRMSETLEGIARSVFKSWFVDFDPVSAKMEGRWRKGESLRGLPAHLYDLFPDRLVDSELGEIPERWEVGSVYEVAEVIYGAPFASTRFNTDGIGEPLIRIRDLANESPSVWTPEVHPKGYKVRPGDIVVGMDGEFRAYLWGGAEGWLNQRVCVFKPKPGWSAAFVRNAIIDHLANVEATETATTVIHLGKADIDLFTALLPSPGLADLFNRACQPWYDRIVAAKQEFRTLAAIRDALLPKLISGELRIGAPDRFLREVAS